ncbi:hypothetical protein AVEN_179206-1 [Araneus ventricosus]|uniref:Integrase catalytic domain-containing protein n=1 Tax=Araneus ventricosus TaxID=182803 RepID=A0A4Y2C7F6_ARAVE|nr:hypothetical protein AVEN_179206-1 [Araneus ventricosus]
MKEFLQIVSSVQNGAFNEEVKCIKANKPLGKNIPLSALCPFIDQDGLLMVGGRVQNAPLQYNAKHPAILPNKHKLKLVSDLTSKAFIAALKRFCSSSGTPKDIHSDNGTTFIGAKKKLGDLFKFISKINLDENICFFFISHMKIEWHTIPPLSPHFGGLWEAGVKSVKFHLKRVIGNTNLTFEELSTLLTQIEAVLNSRPLIKLDDNDVASLTVLTPSHFLIGDAMTSPPEILEEAKLSLKDLWDIVQKMKLIFLKRWHMDYLISLQSRDKWKKL